MDCFASTTFTRTESGSSDVIIDGCNYLLQTHFRLANVLKLLTHQEKLHDEKLKHKLNHQLNELMYSILTDSLSLNSTGLLSCYSDKKKAEWNDMLMNKFKKLRFFLQHQQTEVDLGDEKQAKVNASTDSLLDTCRLSIDVLNDDN